MERGEVSDKLKFSALEATKLQLDSASPTPDRSIEARGDELCRGNGSSRSMTEVVKQAVYTFQRRLLCNCPPNRYRQQSQ